MKQKIKLVIMSASIIALLVPNIGLASLTLDGTSVVSDAALTLSGAATSTLNLGTTATTPTINIGTALTTGNITIGGTATNYTGVGTGTITIGRSTQTNYINIGVGSMAASQVQNISLGPASLAASAVSNLYLGIADSGAASSISNIYLGTAASSFSTVNINIGNGGTRVGVTNVNIADTATFGAGDVIKIGNTGTASTLLLSGGTVANSGGITANGPFNYGAATGTDTYTLTLRPAPTAYTAGLMIVFTVANANTGAATINVNTLGAKSIVKGNNAALAANDMIVNRTYIAVYDGTQFDLINPAVQ